MERTVQERVVTVFVRLSETDSEMRERIDEMNALVESCGGEVVSTVVQSVESINPRTVIGSGKVREIADFCENEEIGAVIFEQALTGAQMKNLSDTIPVKILDRLDMILDIFALRARTARAKLQVKLAQLEYRLPRLKGIGAELSRTGGGIGTRGPGEQKLETDRRAILREIHSIKTQLERMNRQQKTLSVKRKRSRTPVVALCGYTNVGKSTIMNGMLDRFGKSEKTVYADDRLFATLDSSVRRIEPDDAPAFLLMDTVGFIREMPEKILSAFDSTLLAITEADLILVVIDSASEEAGRQIETTAETLKRLEADAPVLYVLNKADLGKQPPLTPKEHTITISAKKPEDIERLCERISAELFGPLIEEELRVPYDRYAELARLRATGIVLEETHEEAGVAVRWRTRPGWIAD